MATDGWKHALNAVGFHRGEFFGWYEEGLLWIGNVVEVDHTTCRVKVRDARLAAPVSGASALSSRDLSGYVDHTGPERPETIRE